MKLEAFYYGAWNLDEEHPQRRQPQERVTNNSGCTDANAAQNFIVQLNTSF